MAVNSSIDDVLELRTDVNRSRQQLPEEFTIIRSLYDVICYVAVALGIPGNVLSSIVWLRRHIVSKNSSAVYLAALAVDDLIFLLNDLYIQVNHCQNSWPCLVAWYLSRSAATLEPLLVLGFSVERLIYILRPLQVRMMMLI